MDKLLKAVKSLLVDIDSKREGNSEQFGDFSDFELDSDGVYVEWPNLAISADNVVQALEEYELGQIIDGELADQKRKALELKAQIDDEVRKKHLSGTNPRLLILDDIVAPDE